MKKTLLEMTQSILSSMDSDEVNSYSDTVESEQVAGIIRDTYYYLVSFMELPEHREQFRLEGLGDTSQPSHLKVPDAVNIVDWFKYDVQTATNTNINYRELTYLEPLDFVEYVSQRTSSDSDVDTVLQDTAIKLLIKNDTAPMFWTSFDDQYIVCDSYDSAVDSTLQTSKTLAYGLKVPTFTMSDSFTPDLDPHMFSLLENEAKSQAFIELKQQANPKAEQRARKLLTKHERREGRVTHPRNIAPDFGRRGYKG